MKDRPLLQRKPGILVLAFLLIFSACGATALAAGFLYVSDRRIVSVELINQQRAIFNYINLDDEIAVIESRGVALVDSRGTVFRGHLFRTSNTPGSGPLYMTSELLGPGKFQGFDLLSNFRFEGEPDKAYFRLGARLIELEEVDADEFEIVVGKIGDINLAEPNRKLALIDAGFWKGYGQILDSSLPETAELESRIFPEAEPAPPVIMKNPSPRLPGKFRELADPVVVGVELLLTEDGAIRDLRAKDSVDPELDRIAIEAIRNSWTILPAISNGKPVATSLVVRVQFDR